MSAGWIEGHFEGVYSGPRRPPIDSRKSHDKHRRAQPSTGSRRFGFEIESGLVHGFTTCDEPDPRAIDDDQLIRQSRVKGVRLIDADNRDDELETSLFDVQISDWQLKYPAEAGDRAYGTIVGTIRARRRPSTGEPAAINPVVPDSPQPLPEKLEKPGSAKAIPRRNPEETHERNDPSLETTRLGWAEVALLVSIVFAVVGYACGLQHAVAWLAPVATALAISWLTPDGIVRGAPPWMTRTPTAIQLLVVLSPLSIAWKTGCWPALGIMSLALLAVPVVLSAFIGSRGSIWMTGAIWTAILCSSCGATDASSCRTIPTKETSAVSETPSMYRPARRTDEQGRWPVMPPASTPSVAPGLDVAPGAARVGPPGADVGPTTPSLPDVPQTGPAPRQAPAANTAISARSALPPSAAGPSPREAPPTSGDGHLTQVDGGWLSPEHRRAPREHVLISIEQANRTPALFFDSGGAHRVYLPTDPIFENGSSSLRRDAPVVLARIAALLSLPSQPRVLLEVHSDSAGDSANQVALTRRRADNVRSWLVDRGHVPASRFEMHAIGGTRPLVPPDGDYGAQQPNRRIEIRIVE